MGGYEEISNFHLRYLKYKALFSEHFENMLSAHKFTAILFE